MRGFVVYEVAQTHHHLWDPAASASHLFYSMMSLFIFLVVLVGVTVAEDPVFFVSTKADRCEHNGVSLYAQITL